jgi:CheY-like chemotaxis protein
LNRTHITFERRGQIINHQPNDEYRFQLDGLSSNAKFAGAERNNEAARRARDFFSLIDSLFIDNGDFDARIVEPLDAETFMMTGKETRENGSKGLDTAKKPRLLVLDTSTYQKLFDAILGHDYELLATDKPGEAVLLASLENPDLILINHTAEKTDGITVAREIRETAASIAPILLMLTSDKPTIRREAQKAGCNGVLIKPFDPDKLKAQLDNWLKAEGDRQ